MGDPRRRIPRTDAVLADPRLKDALDLLGADLVKAVVTTAQQRARDGLLAPEAVTDEVLATLPATATSVRPVLNATGVVVHTNLGRAPLSAAAVRALQTASGYVDVEFDLGSGKRATRGRGTLAALLARVPTAGAALVVNNAAAALVLVATALARGREIIISRGELIEIGDGFRLPDLIESTGARIREVGTTNRVTVADYADAIGPDTACIVKIHPSNFRIEGFTASVPVGALAGLGVPVVCDLGSGLLAPDPALPDEPDIGSALAAGAALALCSGDKLLGGPQAGLVLGEAALVEQLRRHPLARALRVDKLTLAALEATLTGPPPPVTAAVHADPAQLRERTERLAESLAAGGIEAVPVASSGAVGGGGAPGQGLPGWAVAIAEGLAAELRRGDPAVVARIERGLCLLDLRCVPLGNDRDVLDAVRAAHLRASAP